MDMAAGAVTVAVIMVVVMIVPVVMIVTMPVIVIMVVVVVIMVTMCVGAHASSSRRCETMPRGPRGYNYSPSGRAGAHLTSSMRGAPVASITSRSKPRAMPLVGGMEPRASRKSSSIG